MKFIVFVHPGDLKDYEDGILPEQKLFEAMGKYNEELVESGVMIGGEGLKPSSSAVKVHFSETGKQVVDGPFSNVHNLIGGFWIWHVSSKEEAVEWAKKAPMEPGATLELRQAFEPEDFGPEIAQQERKLIDKIEKQKK